VHRDLKVSIIIVVSRYAQSIGRIQTLFLEKLIFLKIGQGHLLFENFLQKNKPTLLKIETIETLNKMAFSDFGNFIFHSEISLSSAIRQRLVFGLFELSRKTSINQLVN